MSKTIKDKSTSTAPGLTSSGPLRVDVRGLGVDLSLHVDPTAPLPRKLSEIGCALATQFGRLLEARGRPADAMGAEPPVPAPTSDVSPPPGAPVVDETPVSCAEDLLRKYGPRGIQQLIEPLISYAWTPPSWPKGAWDNYLHQLAVAMVDLEAALRAPRGAAPSAAVPEDALDALDVPHATPTRTPIASILGSNYTTTEMRDAAARMCRQANDDTLAIWAEEIAKARAGREPS